MLQIFWGSVFLLFDINVSVHCIDVLPDFIGWILVAVGLKKLSQHSRVFKCVKVIGIFMILISIIQAAISFMGSGNFVYNYISKYYGIENADSAYLLTTVFWGLKMVVLTLAILALFKIRDRISDTQSIKRLGAVWLVILAIELSTYAYKNLIMDYLPNSIQKAIMQILVVGVIFFKIWFIFSEFKITKDYKPY